eukprot:scaffold41162_cov100-Skeletonema_dohrnii-CCMP3373.AAC.2
MTDGRTDGRTVRNFSEMPGKLCFARLKAGLNKLKLETKLGQSKMPVSKCPPTMNRERMT